MKLYLDDMRIAPEGWVLCAWPEEVIEHLKTGEVTEVSLDWDLGEFFCASPRTGYDVLHWLEDQVANHGFQPPRIRVHTSSLEHKRKMKIRAREIRIAAAASRPTPEAE